MTFSLVSVIAVTAISFFIVVHLWFVQINCTHNLNTVSVSVSVSFTDEIEIEIHSTVFAAFSLYAFIMYDDVSMAQQLQSRENCEKPFLVSPSSDTSGSKIHI